MKTTLNKIRENNPCPGGWEKLLKHLGKTQADDEPLSILTILDSNGLNDAIWCLRAVEGRDKEIRLFAVWCARQVQHLLTDKRSLDALDTAERYANGQSTDAELKDAWDAAADAARAAAWCVVRTAGSGWAALAARAAAWFAADAVAAARSTAEATRSARDAAACAAAEDAAGDAAWAATWEAARAKQEAELRRICEER